MNFKFNWKLTAAFVPLLAISSIASWAQTPATNKVSLDQKIGQMLMVGFRGLDAVPGDPIVENIRKFHIGGVVLFDYDVPADTSVRNIRSPEQVSVLTSDLQDFSHIPLFIAIDQEGGKVARLKPSHGFPPTVSAAYLGRFNHPDTTAKYARRTAEMLHNTGINVNLAPVVDVNLNPDNPVIGGLDRSISGSPAVVAEVAELYIRLMHREGIITALKHFPGHGSSENDSHKEFVDVTGHWKQTELAPYRRLVSKGLADMVMTAHIFNARLDSMHPATLSGKVINGLLRDSLQFKGVVISDDMQMNAIRSYYGLEETILKSIRAGVDILVFANNTIYDEDIARKAHTIIKNLVQDGSISPERIDTSFHRIMQLKEQYLIRKKK